MLRVLPTRYCEILASDLIREYAAECSISAIGQPDPQADIYELMENSGLMKCFGVYRDAQMVGFATVLVSLLPHYGQRVATVESLFVTASERKGLTSGRLLKNVEAYANASGCVAILYSAPTGGALEVVLNDHKDYERTNVVYCRRLA